MKTKNIFQHIADFYRKGVKKADENGYSEKLKICAEAFFKCVNEELGDCPVTFEDVMYLDGYFVFGFGTNSVVNFHIKECPGWLFGIWWTLPDKKPKQSCVRGEFFAQYEENIDKFKPSASIIQTTINAYPDGEEPLCSVWDASNIIKFIAKEPYLAFCRDYCCWNYNIEHHTREEAKAKFEEWHEWSENKKKITAELDTKVLDFVKTKIMPSFAGSEIVDSGEHVYPRYGLIAPYEKNKDMVEEPGLYDWFEIDKTEGRDTKTEYETLLSEGEKLSDEYEFMWFKPFHATINFYEKDGR